MSRWHAAIATDRRVCVEGIAASLQNAGGRSAWRSQAGLTGVRPLPVVPRQSNRRQQRGGGAGGVQLAGEAEERDQATGRETAEGGRAVAQCAGSPGRRGRALSREDRLSE